MQARNFISKMNHSINTLISNLMKKKVHLIPDLQHYSENLLENKKVILSGSFSPASEEDLLEPLLIRKARIFTDISPEIDYIICGEDPDWNLIEEAALYGIDSIFLSKEKYSDYQWVCHQCQSSSKFYEVPLGI